MMSKYNINHKATNYTT